MKRTEAVDEARKMAAAGHTAYICYNKNDGLCCLNKRPDCTVVLIVEPDRMFSRETLISLLTHRMRLKKVPGVACT